MLIRLATPSDIPQLAALYRDSVQKLAPQCYSPEQVTAWASFGKPTHNFNAFILKVTTFIAEQEQKILGFCGIAQDGHIASLYVHPDHFRQKIGSHLLQAVLDYAQAQHITQLYVEASVFSWPLFEKLGFVLAKIEQVERVGVQFERYILHLTLTETKSLESEHSFGFEG